MWLVRAYMMHCFTHIHNLHTLYTLYIASPSDRTSSASWSSSSTESLRNFVHSPMTNWVEFFGASGRKSSTHVPFGMWPAKGREAGEGTREGTWGEGGGRAQRL